MDRANSLFLTFKAPKTEGIKYIGSKRTLLPYILALIGQTKAQTVLDGFSGTTRVAQALAKSGYTVLANDQALWSYIFAQCYLKNRTHKRIGQPLLDHLNTLPPQEGWFTEHYGGDVTPAGAIQPDGLKKPWQKHNTRKLDTIRNEIDRLTLSESERALALTSLMLALDKVDNTLGHFCSYLKTWSARSYTMMKLTWPSVCPGDHAVFQEDIFDLLQTPVDLVYLDPPYGSRNDKMPPSRVRYAGYYHLWKTICLNDRPALFGKSLRRQDSTDHQNFSVFEDYKKNPSTNRYLAAEALARVIQEIRAPWIILSYSSGGRVSLEDLSAIITSCATLVTLSIIDYKRNVMADMCWTNDWITRTLPFHQEYLFLLKKK